MRVKDAKEIITKMEPGETVQTLGNGKIPNVHGPGLLTISCEHDYDTGKKVYYYTISDTHWDKGVWRAVGGRRGDVISQNEAIKMLAAYGRSRNQVKIIE
jgi:hypothetical protein